MKGLELSKKYFEEFGKPMLEENFPEVLPFLAVGLFGAGSECLGYDDELSGDHDFEPGFMILLPGEDIVDRRTEFQLERAYAKLPKEFMGYKRSMLSPVGGPRHGVIRISDFFMDKVGSSDGNLTVSQWLNTPEHFLLEATNGEVFFDNLGLLSGIRDRLFYYPQDILLKKLAGNLLLMAQSGQYNYRRIIEHGEEYSSQLAVIEFVGRTINVVFLLNERYQPFYKWTFRALDENMVLSETKEILYELLTSKNDKERAEEKYYMMEDIAARVIEFLMDKELTKAVCQDLEKHAYSVNDMISDSDLRNVNILMGV